MSFQSGNVWSDVTDVAARKLGAVMRRDVCTDWTVRDGSRRSGRSRSSGLLIKYDDSPDEQLAAIRLVMEKFETMASRTAA